MLNQLFDSLEKGINFYKEYGRLCGFTTRRNTEKKDDDNRVIKKYIACIKEGFNEKKASSSDGSGSKVIRRRTISDRCGYEEKIILKYVIGESYKFFVFVEKHNLNLLPRLIISF